MLESEEVLRLLVEHIAVCVEMLTAVTTLDEYALAAVLQFTRMRHVPLGDLARWVIISTLCALSLSLLN